ncbi:MAG: SDR family NAD(P)-dependent oxidoreductase [Alphaproteobacteria bacterium]|nr:SDR family NAD(P)-dependent oxidoreductase [Alphaproteobacteria bacterium]
MTLSVEGKRILVTGGSSGIGCAAALALSKAGAEVMLTSRSAERAERVASDIAAASGRRVIGLRLDLASQADIRAFADDFQARFDRLNVLANNAGALWTSRQASPDGYEMTWAVNHLGPMLLTSLLLPLLHKSGAARVVTTASNAHLGGTMAFDGLGLPDSFSHAGAYGRSKLGNVLFTFALARRLEGSDATATCLHPGVVATGFFRFIPVVGPMVRVLATPFLRTPAKGAETLVWLAGDSEAAGLNGGYFYDRKPGRLSPLAEDPAVQDRVWDISSKQVGAVWPLR